MQAPWGFASGLIKSRLRIALSWGIKRSMKRLIFALFLTLNIWAHAADETVSTSQRHRNPAIRGVYVGLGPAALWNLNSVGVAYYVTAGYGFDTDFAIFKLGAELFGRAGAIGLVGSLGANFFPLGTSDSGFDPYLGLDFGFGTSRTADALFSGQWVDGFVLGPNLGVMLMRTSDVNLDIGAKWGFFTSSGALGSPSYAVLRVALHF